MWFSEGRVYTGCLGKKVEMISYGATLGKCLCFAMQRERQKRNKYCNKLESLFYIKHSFENRSLKQYLNLLAYIFLHFIIIIKVIIIIIVTYNKSDVRISVYLEYTNLSIEFSHK